MSRFIQDRHGAVRIPAAWRGNCLCGRWLVVLRAFTFEKPLPCECGRRWYVEGDEARFAEPTTGVEST